MNKAKQDFLERLRNLTADYDSVQRIRKVANDILEYARTNNRKDLVKRIGHTIVFEMTWLDDWHKRSKTKVSEDLQRIKKSIETDLSVLD